MAASDNRVSTEGYMPTDKADKARLLRTQMTDKRSADVEKKMEEAEERSKLLRAKQEEEKRRAMKEKKKREKEKHSKMDERRKKKTETTDHDDKAVGLKSADVSTSSRHRRPQSVMSRHSTYANPTVAYQIRTATSSGGCKDEPPTHAFCSRYRSVSPEQFHCRSKSVDSHAQRCTRKQLVEKATERLSRLSRPLERSTAPRAGTPPPSHPPGREHHRPPATGTAATGATTASAQRSTSKRLAAPTEAHIGDGRRSVEPSGVPPERRWRSRSSAVERSSAGGRGTGVGTGVGVGVGTGPGSQAGSSKAISRSATKTFRKSLPCTSSSSIPSSTTASPGSAAGAAKHKDFRKKESDKDTKKKSGDKEKERKELKKDDTSKSWTRKIKDGVDALLSVIDTKTTPGGEEKKGKPPGGAAERGRSASRARSGGPPPSSREGPSQKESAGQGAEGKSEPKPKPIGRTRPPPPPPPPPQASHSDVASSSSSSTTSRQHGGATGGKSKETGGGSGKGGGEGGGGAVGGEEVEPVGGDDYKTKLQMQRKLAREKAQRDAEEAQRLKEEKEKEETERRAAAEAQKEVERLQRMEEERIRTEENKKQEEERAKKNEEQERAKQKQLEEKQEHNAKEKEIADAKAKLEAEQKDAEKREKLKKEEEERIARKKKLELIMKRVKPSDSESAKVAASGGLNEGEANELSSTSSSTSALAAVMSQLSVNEPNSITNDDQSMTSSVRRSQSVAGFADEASGHLDNGGDTKKMSMSESDLLETARHARHDGTAQPTKSNIEPQRTVSIDDNAGTIKDLTMSPIVSHDDAVELLVEKGETGRAGDFSAHGQNVATLSSSVVYSHATVSTLGEESGRAIDAVGLMAADGDIKMVDSKNVDKETENSVAEYPKIGTTAETAEKTVDAPNSDSSENAGEPGVETEGGILSKVKAFVKKSQENLLAVVSSNKSTPTTPDTDIAKTLQDSNDAEKQLEDQDETANSVQIREATVEEYIEQKVSETADKGAESAEKFVTDVLNDETVDKAMMKRGRLERPATLSLDNDPLATASQIGGVDDTVKITTGLSLAASVETSTHGKTESASEAFEFHQHVPLNESSKIPSSSSGHQLSSLQTSVDLISGSLQASNEMMSDSLLASTKLVRDSLATSHGADANVATLPSGEKLKNALQSSSELVSGSAQSSGELIGESLAISASLIQHSLKESKESVISDISASMGKFIGGVPPYGDDAGNLPAPPSPYSDIGNKDNLLSSSGEKADGATKIETAATPPGDEYGENENEGSESKDSTSAGGGGGIFSKMKAFVKKSQENLLAAVSSHKSQPTTPDADVVKALPDSNDAAQQPEDQDETGNITDMQTKPGEEYIEHDASKTTHQEPELPGSVGTFGSSDGKNAKMAATELSGEAQSLSKELGEAGGQISDESLLSDKLPGITEDDTKAGSLSASPSGPSDDVAGVRNSQMTDTIESSDLNIRKARQWDQPSPLTFDPDTSALDRDSSVFDPDTLTGDSDSSIASDTTNGDATSVSSADTVVLRGASPQEF